MTLPSDELNPVMGTHNVITHVYRPEGAGPHPVVVFAHGYGRGGKPADLPEPVSPLHASFWLKKGFAVVAPLRPGYGVSAGRARESGIDPADGSFQPARRASRAADVLHATARWASGQSWADSNNMVLVGHSTGGIAALEAASRHIEGVVAVVNIAGVIGQPSPPPGTVRRWEPERLADLCGHLGANVAIPALWVYAERDEFMADGIARTMFDRFREHASDASIVHVTCSQDRPHVAVLREGALWEHAVDQLLERLKPSAPA